MSEVVILKLSLNKLEVIKYILQRRIKINQDMLSHSSNLPYVAQDRRLYNQLKAHDDKAKARNAFMKHIVHDIDQELGLIKANY